MTRDGTGWTFKHTRDYTDYTGTLTPDKDGDFIQQLLYAKPQVMDVAITNQDYKLSVSGEDIVMSIDLKCVFEVVEVVLRCDGSVGEVEVKRLKKRVGELEGEVAMLKMGGMRCIYTSYEVANSWNSWRYMRVVEGKVFDPTYDDQLVRYASAFHQPFISFLKNQLNTTIAEAFVKWWVKLKNDALKDDDRWVKRCGNNLEDNMYDYLWKLKIEYMARVRNLSMRVPDWSLSYESVIRNSNDTVSCHIVSSDSVMCETSGLYINGCWGVSQAFGSGYICDQEELCIISGPFKSSPTGYKTGKYDTKDTNPVEFYLDIIPLVPLTLAEKLEHDLS